MAVWTTQLAETTLAETTLFASSSSSKCKAHLLCRQSALLLQLPKNFQKILQRQRRLCLQRFLLRLQ
jgi:hypothetical protein